MNPKNSSITFTFLYSFLITSFLLPFTISSQTCQKTCGNLPIKYPFGTGPGCGDRRFHPYITCTADQRLTFTTHTGCYTITTIDYNSQIITISDPTISTCSCTQPSKGFGLDSVAPFSFHHDTVFALLDCSPASPIYDNATSTFTMCDSQGEPVCNLLNSCEPMSRLSLPISTCCVYAPVDLGPSFDIDLEKLRCPSYSAMYGLNNPEGWKYGIALEYKFSFKNDYPRLCASCERSDGVCGYGDGPYEQFACNCPGGFNTTTDCFYGESWSYGSRFLPWKIGTVSIFCFTWLIILAFM